MWQLHIAGLEQFGANAGEGPWDDDLRDVEAAYLRNGEFLIGEVGGEIVAIGAIRAVTAEVGEPKRVRVDQPYQGLQGHGIGEAISRRLLARASALGFK